MPLAPSSVCQRLILVDALAVLKLFNMMTMTMIMTHDFGSPTGFFRITLGSLDLPLCWKLGLIHYLALISMIIHDDDSENDLDNEDAFGSLCVTDLSWEVPY